MFGRMFGSSDEKNLVGNLVSHEGWLSKIFNLWVIFEEFERVLGKSAG